MSDIGTAISSDAKAFVQTVETDLKQDALAAFSWLKGELEKIEPAVLAQIKSAINEILTDLEQGEGMGVATADVLTILARDGLQDALAVKSDVLTALIGLTTAKAA